MGDPVDLIAIDEDLKFDRHVAEFQARLSDRKGKLIWSCWPHTQNNALIRMSDRAEQQRTRPNLDTVEFRLTFSGNPHIDDDEKRKRLEAWNDDERRSRDLGEFLLDSVLMYPQFSVHVHGVPKMPGAPEEIELDRILRNRQIPTDWTRYMVVDPGHTITAVLFAAVPPPRVYGEHVVAYDELYLKQCDAVKFANAVAPKVLGHYFRAFIIDDHGSRATEAGSGKTVRQQYTEELRKRNIRSETTGHGFAKGSDDVDGRCMEVRRWLTARPDGGTRFRILTHYDAETGRYSPMLPYMEQEFRLYKKRLADDEARDDPVKKYDHLMNALEYLAAYNPQWLFPKRYETTENPVVVMFREWMESERKSRGGSCIHLGPGKT